MKPHVENYPIHFLYAQQHGWYQTDFKSINEVEIVYAHKKLKMFGKCKCKHLGLKNNLYRCMLYDPREYLWWLQYPVAAQFKVWLIFLSIWQGRQPYAIIHLIFEIFTWQTGGIYVWIVYKTNKLQFDYLTSWTTMAAKLGCQTAIFTWKV